MEQCIPKSVLPQKRNLPWLTEEIIQLIRRRNYFYREAWKSGNGHDFQKFKQPRNKVVTELRLAKCTFASARLKYVLEKVEITKHKCTIQTLVKGSVVACTNSEKANLLNASFVAIPELGIEIFLNCHMKIVQMSYCALKRKHITC